VKIKAPAKNTLFDGGNGADVRKTARPIFQGVEQPAKTTLFDGGNGADVRKMAAGRFFQ
jgi:hypothetical protein